VVIASYAMGYRLDWRQLDAAQPTEEEPVEASLAPSLPEAPETTAQPVAATSSAQTAIVSDAGQAQWDEMTTELTQAAGRYQGRVAVDLVDLKTGRDWSYHPDDLFPSASLIKVPVMICVFAKIHDGEMTLHDILTLRRHNRVGGSGSLKWQPDGSKFTVTELLRHMITESDNTATNMLIEAVGMGYIQQEFPKIGLLYTGIYEEGMSLRGGHVAHENYTTAREMVMLMSKIYRGEMIDKTSSQLMLDILKLPRPASRLAKGLPQGWEIAHKTGLLRHACHDSAIFLTPNGDYALTVLTGQNDNYSMAKDFITRLGHITFVHYGGYPRYYFAASHRHRHVALR
jgi:beta-lactamase class A